MTVAKNDPTSDVCKLCSALIAANGNTSNSRRHLQDHHAEAWRLASEHKNNDKIVEEFDIEPFIEVNDNIIEDEEMTRKPRKQIILKSCVPYPESSCKKAKLDEDLARMIAEDYALYSVVERKGLR